MSETGARPVAEDQARAAEAALISALLAKDEAVLRRLLDDDFVGISHTGRRVDKRQFMAVYLEPDRRFAVYETSEVSAGSHGENTVLVDGKVLIKRAEEAEDNVPPKRYLAVYVRGDEGWRVASWQDTPVVA